MKIFELKNTFGTDSENKVLLAKEKSYEGALACLETFYYAFNKKDIGVFKQIWFDHHLIQLNNPLGGIMYGIDAIVKLYDNIFNGPSSVWVEFSDIIVFENDQMVTFAGRETGSFTRDGINLDLRIRTSRILAYDDAKQRWGLVHHHGSIDNPNLLEKYQAAVGGNN